MYNVTTGDKVKKILNNIMLGPIWLVCRAGQFGSWVLENVTGCSLVQWALRVIMGLLILYGLISGLWGNSAILGIPAAFLYVFPYIADFIKELFKGGAERISEYWHTPVQLRVYYKHMYDKEQTGTVED